MVVMRAAVYVCVRTRSSHLMHLLVSGNFQIKRLLASCISASSSLTENRLEPTTLTTLTAHSSQGLTVSSLKTQTQQYFEVAYMIPFTRGKSLCYAKTLRLHHPVSLPKRQSTA